MASKIFNISPPQTINKGLAVDYKPIYPEVISILENERKRVREQGILDADVRDKNLDWFEKKRVSVEGLDTYDRRVVHNNWKELEEEFIRGEGEGQNLRSKENFRGRLNEYIADASLRD